jgi:protein-L-isoaspartate(D-aspartate) O-methyltransferase
VEVHSADGTAFDPGAAHAFYASAGATHVPAPWLDRLEPGGRIVVPLTCTAAPHTTGGCLRVEREERGFSARFISPVGIFPMSGGRDPDLDRALAEAFQSVDSLEVRSLRRDPHARHATCWLHAPGFCLSTAAPGALEGG